MIIGLFYNDNVLSMLSYLGAIALAIHISLSFFGHNSDDSFYKSVDSFDKDRNEPKKYAHRSKPRNKTRH